MSEINELKEIYELSESNPKWLITNIDRIKNLQKDKKIIPKDLIALSKYVSSNELLTKKGFPKNVLLDEYFLSYATPKKFAEYRTNKIKKLFADKSLIDVCCGSGLQLIEFAKSGIKCIGIEKDELRYYLAKININLAYHAKYIKTKPEIYLDDALSSNAQKIAKNYNIIFCDSFRKDKLYSPNLNEVYQTYKTKTIIYEFIPTENIKDIFDNYSFLINNSDIEFYCEKDRCSRLTAYIYKNNKIEFYQNDDYLNLELNYNHNKLDKIKEYIFSKAFPEKEFIMLNKCLIENYFSEFISHNIFKLDKRRYLLENSKMSKKTFVPLINSQKVSTITAHLKEKYKDYYTTLRFELDPKDYWKFINNNNLITNKESKNKFSLFKYKDVYHLCKEN